MTLGCSPPKCLALSTIRIFRGVGENRHQRRGGGGGGATDGIHPYDIFVSFLLSPNFILPLKK